LNEIAQHKIKIYEFPEIEEEEDNKFHKLLRDRVPFAVVGANTVVEHDGKKVRGRKYPWGIAEGAREKILINHDRSLQRFNFHTDNQNVIFIF